MKRFIALLLLALMTIGLCVSVYAADCGNELIINGTNERGLAELIKLALGNKNELREYLIKYLQAYNKEYLNGLPSCANTPSATPVPTATPLPAATPTPTPEQSGNSGALSAYEEEVVRLVNEERRSAGLKELVIDESAANAARARAVEIQSYFSHTRPDGTSCFTILKEYGVSYRGAGENIASGYTSASAVMNGWMSSSGHRANILNASFTKIGVGCYKDAPGRMHWVQLFIY